jgi:hypothetical protein
MVAKLDAYHRSGRAGASGLTITPHQRRVRELEALRRLIAAFELQLEATPGSIPKANIADALEQHMSLLPEGSNLKRLFDGLARQVRQAPGSVIAESNLRAVLVRLRQHRDRFGAYVEARDAKLRSKR